MQCREFLECYSDWRDGLLVEPGLRRTLERHLSDCVTCRRHDRALRQGVLALRTLEQGIEPSAGMTWRLKLRIARARWVDVPRVSRWAGAAATLAVVAGVGYFGLRDAEPVATATAPPDPPAAQPVITPRPVANDSPPFVTFHDPRSGVLVHIPSAYGTGYVERAVVTPADFP